MKLLNNLKFQIINKSVKVKLIVCYMAKEETSIQKVYPNRSKDLWSPHDYV